MIMQVKNLSVEFENGFTLHNLDFSLEEGEIITIVGESGSGKSTLAKALVGLNDQDAKVSGEVIIAGKDIYKISEKELEEMRMREFAIAFQNSRDLLNPLLTIGHQLEEILKKEIKSKEERKAKAKELLDIVGLEEDVLKKRPNELSGGMIQRVLLISSIALNPKVVILDEPTSSLDVASKHKLIHLIMDINKRLGIAFIVITHDFGLAKHTSSKMMIFYRGHLVEQGITDEILDDPQHPYSRGLINSSMDINLYKDVWGIRYVEEEEKKACPFYSRCTQHIESCKDKTPELADHRRCKERQIACNRGGIVTIIEGEGIEKAYGKQRVLHNLDIDVYYSEVVSLVGISGSGKTTLCNILAGYEHADGGTINYDGETANFAELRRVKNGMQMIFQDPETSLNCNLKVIDAILEPLKLNYPSDDGYTAAKNALIDVGLPTDDEFLRQKIKQLSGGQKQRVSIARALTMEPKLLIADEPTSMLDASSKANLIRMLKSIQNKRGLSMLFVTHDLSCAMKISDKIFMLNGEKNLKRIYNVEDLDDQFKASV